MQPAGQHGLTGQTHTRPPACPARKSNDPSDFALPRRTHAPSAPDQQHARPRTSLGRAFVTVGRRLLSAPQCGGCGI